MKRATIIIAVILIIAVLIASFLLFSSKKEDYTAAPGDVVEMEFPFDKKIEFGEYYFDLDNGKKSTYPLCFCLTEKNTYPPDCSGDVKYLFKNAPGTMCIPLKIGSGRCSVEAIKTLGYATEFIIPLEYSWTKPFQKIFMAIRVPPEAPEGANLVIAMTIFKQDNTGKLQPYRLYEKTIKVAHTKGNS